MNILTAQYSSLIYGGQCSRCSSRHQIPSSPIAIKHALEVIQKLEDTKRIDFDVDESLSRPELSTDYLWTKGPGRMLGVMVCSSSSSSGESGESDYVVLKAFSGQMSRHWRVEGWVGPVAGLTHESIPYAKYREVTNQLSSKINQWSSLTEDTRDRGGNKTSMDEFASKEADRLISLRKSLSHELMRSIQLSYKTMDGRGRPLNLLEAYESHVNGHNKVTMGSSRRSAGGLRVVARVKEGTGLGFPAGTGDCCIPKLLHACRDLGLTPHSAVEWWHGSPPNTATRQGRKDPESSERVHLNLYPPCAKCETILGAMLCDSTAAD